MDWVLVSSLLVALGFGGFVGAVAAAALSAARLRAAFEAFRVVFRTYMIGKKDPDSLMVVSAFDEFSDEIVAVSNAIDNLKRSLSRR